MILLSPISSGNKRTTFKSLIDQVRVMKESHSLDISSVHAEIESIKDELANIAEVINGTHMGDGSAIQRTCTCIASAISIDQEEVGARIPDNGHSERDFVENVEIIKRGFYSMKVFVTDKVKDMETMIKAFEDKSAIEKGKVLLKFNELATDLSKLNQTLNIIQNDHSLSMEVFRSEISKSLEDTRAQYQSEIEKSDASVEEKLNGMEDSIDKMRERISPYSDLNDYWLLVFRLRPGDYGGVLEAWTDGRNARESYDPNDADVMFHKYIPFRNYAVDLWQNLRISLVRVALFDENDKEVAFLLFDGAGSDKMNWFSKERLLDSSWGQLRYDSALNFFSIAGDTSNVRRFFINVRYSSCPIDHGFLMILDGNSPRPCDYEKRLGQTTRILYSKYPGGTRWSSEFKQASHMDISIYSNTKGFIRMFRDRPNPL